MRTIALVSIVGLLAGLRGAASGQTSAANGEIARELRFPPRTAYKNPDAILQHYDAMTDMTSLRLGVASGNPLSLILRPIVQLEFEATFNGEKSSAAPDSVVMTSRVFRLQVSRQAPAAAQQPMALQQAATSVPGAPGPMLSFLVGNPTTDAASSPAWRASVASVITASNALVTVDDTGIWFRGKRWLSTVANVIDLERKKGELPLSLLARADTGRFSLGNLPERVRNLLRGGLRLTITEDVHRLAIPVGALLQITSAPNGVKARFGAVDFAIDGDGLDALRDFASRLAPNDGAALSGSMTQLAAAQSTTLQPTAAQAAASQAATQQPVAPQAVATSPLAPPPSTAPQSVAQTVATQSLASGGVAAPVTQPDTAVSSADVVPIGTQIELASGSQQCTDSMKLNDRFSAVVSKPVTASAKSHLDAGVPVLLRISDLKSGTKETDAIHVQISAVSIMLNGRDYPLAGSVIKSVTVKESPSSPHVCVPKNGRLVLKLSTALVVPR